MLGSTITHPLITNTDAIIAKLKNSAKTCVYLAFLAYVVADNLFLSTYGTKKAKSGSASYHKKLIIIRKT
tara:strand:+ start:1740 stop:1949 length:210 start_codon:yes stop_codon:yes gene_type:complete